MAYYTGPSGSSQVSSSPVDAVTTTPAGSTVTKVTDTETTTKDGSGNVTVTPAPTTPATTTTSGTSGTSSTVQTTLERLKAAQEAQKKAQEEAEAQKKKEEAEAKAKKRQERLVKINNFINKLKNASAEFGASSGLAGNWIGALGGYVSAALLALIQKNTQKGVDATEGMTDEQLVEFYNGLRAATQDKSGTEVSKGGMEYSGTSGSGSSNSPSGTTGGTTVSGDPVGTPINAGEEKNNTPTASGTKEGTTTAGTVEDDVSRQEELIQNYREEAEKALKEAQDKIDAAKTKYETSYEENVAKATQQAQKLSSTEAALVQAQRQTAMRNAGQSSNAAAILSAQSVANDLLSSFNNNYTGSLTNLEKRSSEVFDTEITNVMDMLRQNTNILNQEIEYNGQMISIRQALQEMEIAQQQFKLAMQQYETAKTETEKANAREEAKYWTQTLTGFIEIFRKGFNESGSSNLPEGYTVVGEAGPEIIKVPEGTEIIPAGCTENILKSDDKKEALLGFAKKHTLLDKSELNKDFPVDSSIMKTVGLMSQYLNKHKTKDLEALKVNGKKEANYHDTFTKFVALLDK